uniref:Ig-like domain-containing protein n=1 Tax=Nannospalax galili TaxID=1026970 RepID=A0A8C6W2K4_NANGA
MDQSRPSSTLMAFGLFGLYHISSHIFISPDSLTGPERYWSLLALENVPEDVLEYSLYQGPDDNAGNMIFSHKPPNTWHPGPLYSSREKVTCTGNLVIRRSALNDTSNYTAHWTQKTGVKKTGWPEVLVSANASTLVEGMDSVASECLTNPSNFNGKTLLIHRVSRHDCKLQCAIEDIPEILQRSEDSGVSCPVCAHGHDCVVLWPQPDVFEGLLMAAAGSSLGYSWIHSSSLLSASEANLTLPSLSLEGMGIYRCIVENPVTQLTFYREVTVQPSHECRPPPVVRNEFYISGFLTIFLIIVTDLGGIYPHGILCRCPPQTW